MSQRGIMNSTANASASITSALARELLGAQPRELKAALLESYRPKDYRGDVWLMTERDAGTRIDGSRNDLFVLRLEEHSGGGYLWDIDQLKASGFGIVRDELEAIGIEGIGSSRMYESSPSDPRADAVEFSRAVAHPARA